MENVVSILKLAIMIKLIKNIKIISKRKQKLMFRVIYYFVINVYLGYKFQHQKSDNRIPVSISRVIEDPIKPHVITHI